MSREAKNKTANFDKLAGVYRWMEILSFGPLLMRCRCEFLPQMINARRGLILGDGDGRFTAQLLQVNRAIEIDTVDASPAMLKALVRRAEENAARVHTFCVDLRSGRIPDARYDLVVSHFLLDCFSTEEIEALVERVLPVLERDAQWVISEFGIPEASFPRVFARMLVGFLYRAFGLLTGLTVRQLPDHAAVLSSKGLELIQLKTRYLGVLRSELWRYNGNA